jgi:hypothetical protein
VSQFFALGIAIPVGALAAGFIANATSVRTVYLIAAGIVALLCIGVAPHMKPSSIQAAIDDLDADVSPARARA